MAVSKRTRFEVLRRDNYTCRYCRSTDNPLTVDHVTPVALGGSDAPDNLVAACKDCNTGKSSASPDATLVANVREDALRHAEMIKQAYAVLVERMGERDDYINEFVGAFPRQPVPSDWRNSVGRWYEMGVPIELVCDAARIALAKDRTFSGHSRFTYLCGIVWNQVHAINEVVELRAAIDGAFVTKESATEAEEEAWTSGYDFGNDRGWTAAAESFGYADVLSRLLANRVEGTYPRVREIHESATPDWLERIRLTEPDEGMRSRMKQSAGVW